MASLAQWLGLSTDDRKSIEATVGRVRSVAEFLGDAADGLKSLDLVSAIEKASPWAEAVTSSLADAIPAVKFLVKLFTKLATPTEESLAVLAFTTAYQQSVEQALRAVGAPQKPFGEAATIRQKLSGLDELIPTDALDFSRASLDRAMEHPFVGHADQLLDVFADGVGYDDKQRLALQSDVHQRFVVHLKTLLSHGGTAERFAPLRTKLQLGTDERNSVASLIEHAQYQRALYQEAPVFGKEVFALSHIYVDSECGVVDWGTLNDAEDPTKTKPDPFDEQCGGRQSLGAKVLDLLGDPTFRDAIVIQGVAGAGKSAFTQWLSAELVRQGLRPIRILLRDVRLERNRPISEALAQAIRYRDESERDPVRYPRPEDPFLKNRIFNESVRFGRTSICPYVLILDGWDEISISVPEGFKVRLNRMLENIRSEYLGGERDVPVRVILTGRPSAEVSDSSFLYRTTPILTLRPWKPDDLAQYFDKLGVAVNERPLPKIEGTNWPAVDRERFAEAVDRYREAFETRRAEQAPRSQHTYSSGGSTVDILGMPLLAFLAARLLAETSGEGAKAALDNPTTLFRTLLDLTCGAAGKYGSAPQDDLDHKFRYHGTELRHLLRSTATAMTVYGKENISYVELELRLAQEGIDVRQKVDDETSDNPLSQLIVSYYFKGGHTDLGCEFLHKSFREYLTAEDVVEVLKAFGRGNLGKTLPKREPYWQDFRRTDPQYALSRALANRLGAQWVTREVAEFLLELLTFEIERAVRPKPNEEIGSPTKPLSIEGWTVVRDALADLWEWWTEGVHMRPQPTGSRANPFAPPLAYEIVTERAMPLDVDPRQMPVPPRLITIDSHLGDALFRLTAIAHFQIASATGWADFGERRSDPKEMWNLVDTSKSHQVVARRGERNWTLFRPTGVRHEYWVVFAARIDGGGWRPQKSFPQGCDCRGLHVPFIDITFAEASDWIDWSFANIYAWGAVGGYFAGHVFDHAFARSIQMTQASCAGASFVGADLQNAMFSNSDLDYANFSFANLQDAVFDDASTVGADLSGDFTIPSRP